MIFENYAQSLGGNLVFLLILKRMVSFLLAQHIMYPNWWMWMRKGRNLSLLHRFPYHHL